MRVSSPGVGVRSWCFVLTRRDACWTNETVVKAALKRPKTCQIITLDWLEDSMFAKRRLPEEPYSHLRALKRERERERMRLRVIKGLEKAVREVNPSRCFDSC